MGSLSMFMNLPMPAKAAIFLLAGGGLVGLMMLLMSSGMLPGSLAYLLLIALAIAALVFGLFKFVSKKLSGRKSKPFEQKMADSASATPSGVSDPGSRAQLDDLRKRFEEGIQVFKDHGKDLYTMPWYVIVGEPGSGKTEAMRHSNVGFPPGLQDQLQGVGGTVNMHWWFTNHAVMIDTAGRLMFEDIEPGQTSEWAEFLKMLRTARPNCPLNGMLLVIPADSLIKDSANDIERKGGKIAQQLDNIQRALGVRFPVYIVISKADRINGFREFFEELTDPVTQMQMMGWTNPNDLDTPFDPSMVEQHLRHVRERLVRRRFSLLSDPVHSDDPSGRRIDQVDALYAFPDSLVKLAPRLRRYLEMVFVAGEWSQKPLFLRGIYFTSSMREGDALDSDLAEVLGVQVDALREGKLWERDRSYFLKDVFMEKVFREKGLVTRESNVGRSRRRQSTILMTAALFLAVGVGLWTYYAYRSLDKSIEDPKRVWGAIAEMVRDDLADPKSRRREPSVALVRPSAGQYAGLERDSDDGRTPMEVQRTAYESASRGLSTDPIFWFAAKTTGDAPGAMSEAQRVLFRRYALLPFVDEARRRLANPKIEVWHEEYAGWREMLVEAGKGAPPERQSDWAWSDHAIDALAVLLEIQAAGIDPNIKYTPDVFDRWLASLSDYPKQADGYPRRFLRNDDTKEASWDDFTSEDRQFLAGVMFEWFGADGAGSAGFPGIAEALAADEPYAIGAARAGVNSFVSTWRAGGSGDTSLLGQIEVFARVGGEYRDIEKQVLSFADFAEARTREDFEVARAAWVGKMNELGAKKAELDAVLAKQVVADANNPQETRPLLAVLRTASAATLEPQMMLLAPREVESTYARLLRAVPERLPEDGDARIAALAEMRRVLSTEQAAYTERIKDSVRASVAKLGAPDGGGGLLAELTRTDGSEPAYAERFAQLTATADQIERSPAPPTDVFGFVDAVRALRSEVGRVRLPADRPGSPGALDQQVRAVCLRALEAYQAYHKTGWVESTLDALGDADRGIGALVAMTSQAAEPGSRGQDFDIEDMPWLSAENARLNRMFDEVVARGVLDSIGELRAAVENGDGLLEGAALTEKWATVERRLADYKRAYIEYWSVTVPANYAPTSGAGGDSAWRSAFDTLDDMVESRVFEGLIAVSERSQEALRRLATDEDPALMAYVAQLAADRQGLSGTATGSQTLRGAASMMRGGWRYLTADIASAEAEFRKQLTAEPFSEADFKQRYFAVFAGPPMTPARAYWAGVSRLMLKAMRLSLSGQDADNLEALMGFGGRFPLASDGGRPLSVEEYGQAKALVEWLAGRTTGGGSGVKVREFRDLPAGVADEFVAVQRGETINAAQSALIRDLAATMAAIDGVSEVKLQLAPPVDNGAFVRQNKFVRVMRNGEPIPDPSGRTGLSQSTYYADSSAETGRDLLSLDIPASGGDIELWFWPTQEDYVAANGQSPTAVAVLSMPWHGLGGAASRSASGEGVLVPLRTDQGQGTYSMRVMGLTAMPDSWPTRAEWDRVKN